MTDRDTAEFERLKRIKFRCWHRGMREMDLLMGRFADKYIESLSESDIDLFEEIMEYSDPDLYNWVSGREDIPDVEGRHLIIRLKEFTLAR